MKQCSRVCSTFLFVTVLATCLCAAPVPSSRNRQVGQQGRILNLINRYRYKYRSPFLAGLLSSTMWGMGQMYSGEYTRGSLLVFGDLIYKGLLVGLILKLNNRYSAGGDDSVRWAEFSATDKGLVIGYVISYIGLTIWSTADAVACAKQYNCRHGFGKWFKVSLREMGGSPSVELGWRLPF